MKLLTDLAYKSTIVYRNTIGLNVYEIDNVYIP